MRKRCYHCKKSVETTKEKYVLLGTYDKQNYFSHEAYFHFACWTAYFGALKSKAQDLQQKATLSFGKMFNRFDKISKKVMDDMGIAEDDIKVDIADLGIEDPLKKKKWKKKEKTTK